MKCKEKIDSKNQKFVATKAEIILVISNCLLCNSKKSKFIKEQEASALLSSIRIKAPLSRMAGDRFMPEMYLRQSGFTYSACGPFTKNKERIQKSKNMRDSRYSYQNELDKACFVHYVAYGDFKDLPRRTAFEKILSNKVFNIAKNRIDIKEVVLE